MSFFVGELGTQDKFLLDISRLSKILTCIFTSYGGNWSVTAENMCEKLRKTGKSLTSCVLTAQDSTHETTLNAETNSTRPKTLQGACWVEDVRGRTKIIVVAEKNSKVKFRQFTQLLSLFDARAISL